MAPAATMKVHLDTDLGGDIDDLAALAMLLRWPGVEITGITTVAEEGGRRAGYTRYALRLAGRDDIPVAAGADVSGGHYRFRPDPYPEPDFWPEPVQPAPGPPDAALSLLHQSIERGAIVVGIGPCTNLALLDRRYPGLLRQTQVSLVGGHLSPPRRSRSAWGNDMDYNFQLDVASAHYVLTHGRPTIIPLHGDDRDRLAPRRLARARGGRPIGRIAGASGAGIRPCLGERGDHSGDLPRFARGFHQPPL